MSGHAASAPCRLPAKGVPDGRGRAPSSGMIGWATPIAEPSSSSGTTRYAAQYWSAAPTLRSSTPNRAASAGACHRSGCRACRTRSSCNSSSVRPTASSVPSAIAAVPARPGRGRTGEPIASGGAGRPAAGGRGERPDPIDSINIFSMAIPLSCSASGRRTAGPAALPTGSSCAALAGATGAATGAGLQGPPASGGSWPRASRDFPRCASAPDPDGGELCVATSLRWDGGVESVAAGGGSGPEGASLSRGGESGEAFGGPGSQLGTSGVDASADIAVWGSEEKTPTCAGRSSLVSCNTYPGRSTDWMAPTVLPAASGAVNTASCRWGSNLAPTGGLSLLTLCLLSARERLDAVRSAPSSKEGAMPSAARSDAQRASILSQTGTRDLASGSAPKRCARSKLARERD
mmetsp:Transcript_25052/g.80997  ORF Transcript_25052/g.80997 Transcript_25052/m.80997 type:complete len:405 (+) Transcript_25052:323-1537(+)